MKNIGLSLRRIGGRLPFHNRYRYSGARLTITPPAPKQHVIMNSVLSLTGAARRYRRKDSAAEIRAGQR
jgi:hypothetical protein